MQSTFYLNMHLQSEWLAGGRVGGQLSGRMVIVAQEQPSTCHHFTKKEHKLAFR